MVNTLPFDKFWQID